MLWLVLPFIVGCGHYVPILFGLGMVGSTIFSIFTLLRRPGKRLPGLIRFVSLIITGSLAGIGLLFLVVGIGTLSSYLHRYGSHYRYG